MSKWIKVEDDLPKDQQIVDVFGGFGRETNVRYDKNMGFMFHGEITHWMPYPEEPKD